MELYNVGRNTVREAVHALAAQGIVDVRPGRGATVLGISTDQALDAETVAALLSDQAITDLYEFRRLIEVETAGRAADRAEPADLEALELALETFLHAYKEMMPTWKADVEFHWLIAAASHNVIYGIVLDAMNDRLLVARHETQRLRRALALAAESTAPSSKQCATATRCGRARRWHNTSTRRCGRSSKRGNGQCGSVTLEVMARRHCRGTVKLPAAPPDSRPARPRT